MYFLNIYTQDKTFVSIHSLAPFFHIKVGAENKAHQFRALNALAENLGYVPSSYIVTQDLVPLLTSVGTAYACCTYTLKQTHTCTLNK